MLKICFDATPVRGKLSGIGIYTLNLLQALDKLQATQAFQLNIYFHPSVKNWLLMNFAKPDNLQKFPSVEILPIPVTVANLSAKYFNFILPYFSQYLDNPDIVHGTDHYVYPCLNSFKVMTIHDLTFIKYPNYATAIVKSYLQRIERCLQWTDLVITFSNNTKKDIIKYFKINPDRIYITPQATRYSANDLNADELLKLQPSVNYDFSKPYLLFVSTLEPRKNVVTLIQAFNYLKKKHKVEHQLVLIGQKGWKYQSIFEAIEASQWKQEIHYLNYLSDEQVALFYSQAEVFVYPSHYEGFGLPVLEAMSLGAPVITSNTSSLPEVAGNAALLVNPNDAVELAESILKVLDSSQLRHELIQKGKERAKLFSWQKTAQETLNAYKMFV